MSALPSRYTSPHAVGKQRKQLRPHGPQLRLAKAFSPWGPRARALPEGQRLFRMAGDLVLLAILEHATLTGSQLVREYTWATGEVVALGGIYQKLERLRQQGRVRDVPAPAGGSFVRGIWMAGNTRPVTITEEGRKRLASYRGIVNTIGEAK